MPPPSTQASTAHDFESLGDSLSACADELHQRIMKAIRRNPAGGSQRAPRPGPSSQAALCGVPARASGAEAGSEAASAINGNLEHGISHGAAQALFENEVALRQRANSLYVDAAVLAEAGLGASQCALLDLVAVARRRIRHANILKDLIGITADMLGLAAAIAAGKPEHLPGVLDSIKQRYCRLTEENAR